MTSLLGARRAVPSALVLSAALLAALLLGACSSRCRCCRPPEPTPLRAPARGDAPAPQARSAEPLPPPPAAEAPSILDVPSGGGGAVAEEGVVEIHDVADLLEAEAGETAAPGAPGRSSGALVNKIEQTASTEKWPGHEQAALKAQGSNLVVKAGAAYRAELAKYLKRLREERSR